MKQKRIGRRFQQEEGERDGKEDFNNNKKKKKKKSRGIRFQQ